ncbi:unnamed protein product [Pylaiella littoralis]
MNCIISAMYIICMYISFCFVRMAVFSQRFSVDLSTTAVETSCNEAVNGTRIAEITPIFLNISDPS